MAPQKNPNYLHQLAMEAPLLLQEGGLAKYSNDAHETVQYLAKMIWGSKTAKGSMKNGQLHPIRVVAEHYMMYTHLWSTVGPHGQLKITRKQNSERQKVPMWLGEEKD